MAHLRLFAVLLLLAPFVRAQAEEELTPYSVVEIESYLKVFNQTYKDKKLPEEDAVAVLEDLLWSRSNAPTYWGGSAIQRAPNRCSSGWIAWCWT